MTTVLDPQNAKQNAQSDSFSSKFAANHRSCTPENCGTQGGVHSALLALALRGFAQTLAPDSATRDLISTSAHRIAELELENVQTVVLTPSAMSLLDHVLGIYDPDEADCSHFPDGAPKVESVEKLRVMLKTASSVRVVPNLMAQALEQKRIEEEEAGHLESLDLGATESGKANAVAGDAEDAPLTEDAIDKILGAGRPMSLSELPPEVGSLLKKLFGSDLTNGSIAFVNLN